MTAPDRKKQKSAIDVLDSIFRDTANFWVIHYSCESFYDRTDGTSPRVTSIAVRRLDNGQTFSFSIHQVAERQHIPLSGIDAHYDSLEKKMLEEFYAHIGSHRGMKFLHWNMRDINYGFAALGHRYQVLGGDPVIVADDKKFDLARIFIDIYGVGYIGHPRLEKLLEKNSIQARDFLPGAGEAEAFEARNFVGLHQSTLRKVDILANIAERAHHRNLKTNTTWWEMHGGRARTFLLWLSENKLIALLASVASVGGLVIAIYALP